MDPILGQIVLFAGNFAPQGWAFCNGATLAVNSNAALFSIIGTQYGGNGTTTFQLPDLRSRVPFGNVMGTAGAPGLTPYQNGNTGGFESVTILGNQVPAHIHPMSGSAALPTMSGTVAATAQPASTLVPGAHSVFAQTPDNQGQSLGGPIFGPSDNVTKMPVTFPASSVTLGGNTGANAGGTGHENRQPFQALNYIIATSGIYPTRP